MEVSNGVVKNQRLYRSSSSSSIFTNAAKKIQDGLPFGYSSDLLQVLLFSFGLQGLNLTQNTPVFADFAVRCGVYSWYTDEELLQRYPGLTPDGARNNLASSDLSVKDLIFGTSILLAPILAKWFGIRKVQLFSQSCWCLGWALFASNILILQKDWCFTLSVALISIPLMGSSLACTFADAFLPGTFMQRFGMTIVWSVGDLFNMLPTVFVGISAMIGVSTFWFSMTVIFVWAIIVFPAFYFFAPNGDSYRVVATHTRYRLGLIRSKSYINTYCVEDGKKGALYANMEEDNNQNVNENKNTQPNSPHQVSDADQMLHPSTTLYMIGLAFYFLAHKRCIAQYLKVILENLAGDLNSFAWQWFMILPIFGFVYGFPMAIIMERTTPVGGYIFVSFFTIISHLLMHYFPESKAAWFFSAFIVALYECNFCGFINQYYSRSFFGSTVSTMFAVTYFPFGIASLYFDPMISKYTDQFTEQLDWLNWVDFSSYLFAIALVIFLIHALIFGKNVITVQTLRKKKQKPAVRQEATYN